MALCSTCLVNPIPNESNYCSVHAHIWGAGRKNEILKLQRKGAWHVDFISSSEPFHAIDSSGILIFKGKKLSLWQVRACLLSLSLGSEWAWRHVQAVHGPEATPSPTKLSNIDPNQAHLAVILHSTALTSLNRCLPLSLFSRSENDCASSSQGKQKPSDRGTLSPTWLLSVATFPPITMWHFQRQKKGTTVT